MELSDLIQSVPSPNLFAPDGASVKKRQRQKPRACDPGWVDVGYQGRLMENMNASFLTGKLEILF